ncbi:MAG: ISAzo13 family transposase, partial [Acidimicrobiales bacterium]
MEVTEEGLGEFFDFLLPHLVEKQRRLLAGATARLVGRGGIKVVAETAGMGRNTVIDGTKAFDVGETPTGRVRAEGGGRPVTEEVDPTLLGD